MLKNEYVLVLYVWGVCLVCGIDYSELLKVFYVGIMFIEVEFDVYVKELLIKFVDDLGIDGLDIDMEICLSEKDIVLFNGVICVLLKYIGLKLGMDCLFLYDINVEYLLFL